MNDEDYEKEVTRLEEYREHLYSNYVDHIKIADSYVFTLSSSAIFAFFLLFYKFGSGLDLTTIVYLKYCTAFFLFSVITIVSCNIAYSLDASINEKKYFDLESKMLDPSSSKDDILKKIDTQDKKFYNSKLHMTLEVLRYVSYVIFIAAIVLFAFLIFTFGKAI